MRTYLDAEALHQWAALALDGMREHRDAIDALNVFPVPDGDTGTNMYLTLEAGVAAMLEIDETAPEPGSARLAALAKGMLLGARGNSGIIASELMRGITTTRAADLDAPLDGMWLAAALRRAADAARAAVASPKEGTLLTVADAAAAAALHGAQESAGNLKVAAESAALAAREALARTTEQLEALRRAGVVDAGGRGYVVLTDALLEVVSGVHRELPEFPRVTPQSAPGQEDEKPHGYGGPAYEVMYLLDAPDDAVLGLKSQLGEMGDSLVVVGGDGLWNVHVHVDDAGAAVEAALPVGRPHRIRITYLTEAIDPATHTLTGRALVVLAHGDGVAGLLEESGVTVVRAPEQGRASMQEMLAGVEASGAREVALLPGDKDSIPVAESAANAARELGLRVAVIPTRSIVQSMAAVAMHVPSIPFDDDVAAMTQAASETQYAGLTTAVREALTNVGTCRIGDELGVISGEIAAVGADLRDVATSVLSRMLDSGTREIVTVLMGRDAPDGLLEAIREWVTSNHPGVEVLGFQGGQPRWHAIIGVE